MEYRAKGWLCPFPDITCRDFQIANLIKLNGLKTRVGNWQRFAGHGVTDLEMVFGVSTFSNANEKFSGFVADTTAHPGRITQIRMATLIE